MIEDLELLRMSDRLQESIRKLRSDGKLLLAYAAERFNRPFMEVEQEWDEKVDDVSKYVDFRAVLRPSASTPKPCG
jgi:hypothetical protein